MATDRNKPSEYGGGGDTYTGRSHSTASTELRRVYRNDDNGFDRSLYTEEQMEAINKSLEGGGQ